MRLFDALTSGITWVTVLVIAILISLGLLISNLLSGSASTVDVERLITERQTRVVEGTASVVITERTAQRLAMVQPIPSQLVAAAGGTTAAAAIAYDPQGRQLNDVTFHWSMKSPQAGAISRGGIFRGGYTTGTFGDAVLVEARSLSTGESVQAFVTVTIVEPGRQRNPAGIRVFPTEVEVELGQELTFLAYPVDLNGVMVPGIPLRWQMVDPAAGSIRRDGHFIAGQVPGTFKGAIQVSISPGESPGGERIQATADIRIIDPSERPAQLYTSVIPPLVRLNPGEQFRLTALVLDQKGDRVAPLETTWELEDGTAGALSIDGLFRAGAVPGVYEDVVKVNISAPKYRGGFVTKARATVIVGEVPPLLSEAGPLVHFLLYPEQLTLSPGESSKLYFIGTDGNGQPVNGLKVQWSLDQPELGEVDQTGKVTAFNRPGTYPGTIRARIVSERGAGAEMQEVKASLIIRGPLYQVKITPSLAQVGPGERVQFTAVARDENGIVLPDGLFRWAVLDPRVGSINSRGLLTASKEPGEYQGVIKVSAIQTLPLP